MIGTKKLSTIRHKIEQALASGGTHLIQRLERLVASAKSKGDHTEVLEGLKRLLESPRRKSRNERAETKKRARQKEED